MRTQLGSLKPCFGRNYQKISKSGIWIANQESWKPHLTLANLRKVPKLRKEANKLHPSLTSDFRNTRFGGELVQEIEFCSMNGPKSREN